jgi:two-component system cell cycle sensor histidine kinase/response regulator CckA
MAAILVVEDERVVARDIEESLMRMGYDVVGLAASSTECLAHAEERRPDLVLMDIRIEGAFDGIETARLLRSRFDVPVIFLTAYADDQTVARAKETEALGYILKPFRAGELKSAVEIALFKHEMEMRLKLRERWFATTLRAIGDAVVAVDRDGRINFANPVAEAILGRSADELVGHALPDVFKPIDERTRAPIELPSPNEVLAGNSTPLIEGAAIIGPNGECPIEDSLSPIVDDNGQLLGAVIVFRDVTEARRMRERVALSERLASLGTLAAGVAHEINNPLTYVLGNASVVARELERVHEAVRDRRDSAGALLDMVAERTHSLAEALLEIQDGAERIRSIVVDLRAFSRPETAERPGDVRSALDWAIRVIEPELRLRARLVTNLVPLPTVRASGSHLGQVFLNLLLNAAQAIPDGAPADNFIEVSTSLDPRGFAVIDVRDSGSGMPPEVMKRIFEPFFTTKAVGTGTGLGLSICHGVITSAGGHIEVESNPGVGTRFRVRLPIEQAPPKPQSLEPKSDSAAKKSRVLVIDDETQVGTAIRRILSEHEVVSHTTAVDALKFLEEDVAFDLILCDVAMAEVSGREFYERLARISPELGERVVFMTGGAFTPDIEQFLQTTTRPCLTKPFGAAELRDDVNALLKKAGRRQA